MPTHPYPSRIVRGTVGLAAWTAAWVASLALAAFGPEILWDHQPAPTLLAIAFNVLVGVGMLFANKRYLQAMDELQRTIQLQAMAWSLGAGLVGGVGLDAVRPARPGRLRGRDRAPGGVHGAGLPGRMRRRLAALPMKNRLKVLRAARDWTQADLALALEVSRQTVNAIETGKYDPSLPLAFRLARLFGLSIEDIFQDQAEI